MKEESHIPTFVPVIAITLGCLDLIRGFLHTIMLEYAATNIAGLDLSTSLAGDLLQEMGAFGISNYLTGIMLILIGWRARPLALAMLGIIPVAYIVGIIGIRVHSAAYAPSQAAWGGTIPMLVYLAVSAITFVVGVWITLHRRKSGARRDDTL
jgi:uncharacterized membrane protein YiaA